MYALYGNIYQQYTPNVSIYTIHGSYGIVMLDDACGMFGMFSAVSGAVTFQVRKALDLGSWILHFTENHIRYPLNI